MTKTKTTKRALIASVLSLLVCFSMLIGSTFAWFTDTATTGVNTIQAGTLEVGLVDEDGNSLEGKSLSFADVNGNTDILWEPNCTFKTQAFRVVNDGNLQFKYKIIITGLEGDSKLLDVIKFSLVTEKDLPAAMEGRSVNDEFGKWQIGFDENGKFVSTLIGRMGSELKYVVAHMDKDAGNEYQGLTLEGIGITVIATQDTVENDIFNDQYDAEATYPVSNAADLADALASGKSVTIDGGVYEESIDVTAGQTVNVDNATITDNVNIENGSKVIINDADVATSWSTRINLNDGTLIINDGEYNGVSLFENYNSGSIVTINGGTFNLDYLTMNNNQSTAITINGGYFDIDSIIAWNFAPNCTVSGGTFTVNPVDIAAISDGYTVVDNGDGTWTVQ